MSAKTEKPNFPRYIDSTMRKDLAACDRKFFYAWMMRLKPIGRNPHLHFGACFAKGLELSRKAFYGEKKSPLEAFAIGAKGIIKEWGDYEPPSYGSGANKTLLTCLTAFHSYYQEYPMGQDVVTPYMTPAGPAVEFNFALPIPGTKHPQTGEPIIYTGRFDQIGTYQDSLFVVDEKTSGYLGDAWRKQWDMASQITGYIWACKSYKIPVAGAIIRGIAILKYDHSHIQHIVQRENWMIDRWLEQLRRDIDRAINSWETGYWDFNLDDACNSYSGCNFLPLCTSKNIEKLIPVEYEHNSWNPLSKDH